MVCDAGLLGRFCAVFSDKLFGLNVIGLEELAHGIEILHWHDVVFRIMEEHHIEVFAGRPAAGERIWESWGQVFDSIITFLAYRRLSREVH